MNDIPVIELKNLTKYYHDAYNITVGLKKVSTKFYNGEFIAITGESGSGKTTMLNVISGLVPYEEGELLINGEPTSHYDEEDWENFRREYIGFVFQGYKLIEAYTAFDNVCVALLLSGLSEKEAKEETLSILEKVGLLEYKTHKARQLSSGQRQRLSIARALAKRSPILVADEPTGNLDSQNGREVMKIFKELSKDHLVIVVTHNYAEAMEYATRRVVVANGEIISQT